MANLLNQYISNKPINPSMQAKPAYTIDTTGKVKPLEDKAHLLPSKIFGSPKEYLKDIKQDVLNIGKAAKGKANDHELGRINDLGLKLGAGALAAYLFTKNPTKLGKAMEIIGAGSFLASMALWPKLAIQAPIKARTGVDIHQKYIDSQGRKKMLHQDPQYDLTDLYSQQDLDQMGKKLKVAENLPDRNRFIKQRAKKTAIQGNTLWMMTAGLATPLASALMCNVLEKPVSTGIEKANLALTKGLVNDTLANGVVGFTTKNIDKGFVSKFCKEHADEVLTDTLIDELATRMTKGMPEAIRKATKEQIAQLATTKIDKKAISSIFEKCGANKDLIDKISPADIKKIQTAISTGKYEPLIKSLQMRGININEFINASNSFRNNELSIKKIAPKLKELGGILGETRGKNGIINKFIQERVGDIQNSLNANQWGRSTKRFIKALGLSNKELTAIAKGKDDAIKQKLIECGVKKETEIRKLLSGKTEILAAKLKELGVNSEEIEKLLSVDFNLVETKLSALAKDSDKFEAFREKFLGGVDKYNKSTGEGFINKIITKTEELFGTAKTKLQKGSFDIIANAFGQTKPGSASKVAATNAYEKATGARSSFYRMLQAIDIREPNYLRNSLKNSGIAEDRLDDLVEICKKVSFEASASDMLQKLDTKGFELSAEEFKAVAKALYTKTDKVAGNEGYTGFLKEFIGKVINFNEGIVTEHARAKLGDAIESTGPERQALVGENISNALRDTARNMVNSRKWLKMTGIGLAVVTAATLIATLAIGRKGKTEKQVEESNKVNG